MAKKRQKANGWDKTHKTENTMKEETIRILKRGNYSLVVRSSDGNIHAFFGKGIADLFQLYCYNPQILQGASIADKVVGKGAAALMIQGGVKHLHAIVISTPALQLLKETDIKVEYQMEVGHIINYQGNDICPIERLCAPWGTADKCVEFIRLFIHQKSNKHE
ncbi:MAG: DUF1893 domain-containing protein [Prevotella sp.]